MSGASSSSTSNKRKKCQKIEKMLVDFTGELRKFESDVTDLNDDVNSNYLKHGRTAERFSQAYSVLCKFEGYDDGTKKSKRIKLDQVTLYPDINKAVENFIRKKDTPNYLDLISIVKKVNEAKSLSLSAKEEAELASNLLKRSIAKIRKYRVKKEDFVIINSLLDEASSKVLPEVNDPELAKKFESQEHLFKNESEVFQKYVEMKESEEKSEDESMVSSEETERDDDEEEIDVNELLTQPEIIDLSSDDEDI